MNFGTPVPLLVGIILILIAVILFFLDRFKPGYKRDSDVIYAILFLIAGIISLSELTLGILPSLQLMIFTGTLIALLLDNIRRRTPNAVSAAPYSNPGGGGSSYRNPEPPPSRPQRSYSNNYNYEEGGRSEVRAEFDDSPYEQPYSIDPNPPVRQIRGGRDSRKNGRGRDYAERSYPEREVYPEREAYPAIEPEDYREEPENRRSSRRPSPESRPEPRERPERIDREPPASRNYIEDADWGQADPTPSRSRRRREDTVANEEPVSPEPVPGSSRRRPKAKIDRIGDSSLGDYVDFQPLDKPLNLGAETSPTVSDIDDSVADSNPSGFEESSFNPAPSRRRPRRSSRSETSDTGNDDFGTNFGSDF